MKGVVIDLKQNGSSVTLLEEVPDYTRKLTSNVSNNSEMTLLQTDHACLPSSVTSHS